MVKNLKKIVLIGGLMLAGGVYSESNFDEYPHQKETCYEKLSNYLEKQSELYIASDLERKLNEEREKFSKPLYLTQDLLNMYIKQAYGEVQKWPEEFDKRLFRLMLRQESRYNAHAKSWAGAMGLGQIMPITYVNFRPEKFATFKESTDLEKELFNPIENISISLEHLDYISNFCKKYNPSWDTLNLENKRKTILACYNTGHGKIQSLKWDLESKKLKKEQREYPNLIMESYYDPKVKVKL